MDDIFWVLRLNVLEVYDNFWYLQSQVESINLKNDPYDIS